MIKFGTSGWRGIIARDFTFDNVRLATQGIADYLNSSPVTRHSSLVILGYDTRFLGREFSLAAAEVLAANGLEPLLCNRDTPTPVIAHSIRHRKAIGGINMTASHNPAEYQGLKFSTSNGAPATPEVTGQIEANIVKLQAAGWAVKSAVIGPYQCKMFDPQPAYFKHLHKLIEFDVLKKANLKVAVDLSYGTGHGYLDTLLEKSGAKVTLFHNELNPLFGGHHPEPNAENMAGVSKFVRSGNAQIPGDFGQITVNFAGKWRIICKKRQEMTQICHGSNGLFPGFSQAAPFAWDPVTILPNELRRIALCVRGSASFLQTSPGLNQGFARKR